MNRTKTPHPGPLPIAPQRGEGETARPTAVSMMVPHGAIRPDPDQPRKTFSEAALKEMADSIREQGIVQRLILERVPAKYKLLEPELHCKEWRVLNKETCREDFTGKESDARAYAGEQNLEEYYRIVCGERRWRGAAIAGLAEVPADVYVGLTAKQRFDFQFIENTQRENVSALEEAEALSKTLKSRQAENLKFSVEDLAKELGLSRAGLYGRLVLTRLHGPVREALVAGKITTSVAGVVAIVPEPKQQEKLLAEITNENAWNFPFSVRDVQELVDDEYVQQLKDAPFKLDAAFEWTKDFPENTHGEKLPNGPIMVTGCDVCPHRSGNLAAEFPELAKRPNVCTQPRCFHLKCKAHWLAAADKAKTTGKPVLTPAEFRKVKGEYLAADKEGYLFAGHYAQSPKSVLGKHAPEPVLVVTKDGLEKFYKKADVQEAAKKAKVKLQTDNQSARNAETPEERKQRELKEQIGRKLHDDRERLVLDLAPEIAKGLASLKPADIWKLARPMAKVDSWDSMAHAVQKAAKNDQAYVLAWIFNDALCGMSNYRSGEWEKGKIALLLELGVDVRKEEQLRAPALPLKAAAKQGKLREVKPNRKKGKRG